MVRGLLFVVCVLLVGGLRCSADRSVALAICCSGSISAAIQWQQYVHPEQNVDFEIKNGVYGRKPGMAASCGRSSRRCRPIPSSTW